MKNVWASDVRVSKPAPTPEDQPVLVDFGGFAFCAGGICHDVNASDVEEIFFPTFAPEDFDGT